VSVYYPFALVSLQDYRKVDDAEGGEVLLAFMDEDGCRVTLRLSRALAEQLAEKLRKGPEASAAG
jgi:hypothetical protein